MSGEELTEEQLKEQKLEAAKKKYEELKKKKKNKKKKSTELDKEESVEPEVGEAEAKEAVQSEKTDEISKEPEVEEAKEDVKEDTNEEVKQDSAEELKQNIKVESSGDSKNIIEVSKESAGEQDTEEPAALEIGETKVEAEGEVQDATRTLVESSDIEKTTVKNETNEVADLFPDSNKDFLQEISTPKPETNVESPVEPTQDIIGEPQSLVFNESSDQQTQTTSLKIENDQLSAENTELKNQLKQLKFIKLEQQETIETLEVRLKQLELKLKQSATTTTSDYNDVSFQDYNKDYGFDYDDELLSDTNDTQINVIHDLSQWKHFNIDMVSWRSIGQGPLVEL